MEPLLGEGPVMPKTKKYETGKMRACIVSAACERFRESGFDNASIIDIMRDVGMTHGGFYRYFSSKDDLIIASIEEEFRRYPESLDLETTIQYCLGRSNEELSERGCSLMVLTPEIGRLSRDVQVVFLESMQRLFSRFSHSSDGVVLEPPSVAAAIFALLVGTLHLARAVGNGNIAAEILSNGAAAARAMATRL